MQRTHDQRDGRLCCVQHHGQGALCSQSLHAWRAGSGLHKGRVKVGGVVGAAAGCGAHVQRCRQHGVQPLGDGVAKTRHHHGQRHRQTQRCHHAADGHRCALAHPPRTLHGQQGQWMVAHPWCHLVQYYAHHPRQAGDAAHQQQRHAGVGRDRDVPQGWHQRHRRTTGQQCCTQQRVAGVGVQCAQALERLRSGQFPCQPCRPPGTRQCGGHAQCAKHQCGTGTPLQRGCASGKKAPAQITAEQVQRQRGQCSTQGNPQRATHCAQCSRLP